MKTETPQFYTDAGVNVTDRIDKGKTKFFEKRQTAEVHADQKRSYKYQVFDSAGYGRAHIGWGVPN